MTDTLTQLQTLLMSRDLTSDRDLKYVYLPLLPHIACQDGFKVSMQASSYHYCYPRVNYGPWTEVELGYSSEPMPELAEYCDAYDDDKFTATNTVWARVPLEKVAKIIDDHGGLVSKYNS